jgi:hypothetical protein
VRARTRIALRGEPLQRAAPLLLAFALLGWLAWVDGGYFAEAWGWLTVALLMVAGTILVSLDRIRLTRSSAIYLLALAALGVWIAASASWSMSAPRTIVEVQRTLNALGIFAVVGILLAIGFTLDVTSGQALRSLASLSHVALVPALYLTYGRAAWMRLSSAWAFSCWSAEHVRARLRPSQCSCRCGVRRSSQYAS